MVNEDESKPESEQQQRNNDKKDDKTNQELYKQEKTAVQLELHLRKPGERRLKSGKMAANFGNGPFCRHHSSSMHIGSFKTPQLKKENDEDARKYKNVKEAAEAAQGNSKNTEEIQQE